MNLAALFPPFGFAPPSARPAPVRRAVATPVPVPAQELPRHATLRLPDRCVTLQVLKGCVWVTRDGCPVDWVLDAGQCFQQRPGAPVLVHALEDTEWALVTGAGDAQNAR